MLTCYVTREELYRFADVREYVVSDSAIDTALGTSAYTLAESLRGRGIDPSRVQLPLMFEAVDHYEGVAYLAGTHTTSTASAGNQSRLVAELSGDISTPVTITLQGSNDETVWRDVTDVTQRHATIEAQADGTYSVLFVPRHKYYRAVLTCEETITAALYLVDTAPDACIRWAAIASALLPRIDADTTIMAVYEEARRSYEESLNKLVIDYDLNDDGTITADDRIAFTRVRAYR